VLSRLGGVGVPHGTGQLRRDLVLDRQQQGHSLEHRAVGQLVEVVGGQSIEH
jgi:hypothetical protein